MIKKSENHLEKLLNFEWNYCIWANRFRQINDISCCAREKDSGDLNIVTAEDPIEYDLGEISFSRKC